MKGIDYIIKNQKGRLLDEDRILRFKCPICGLHRDVDINCKQSKRAFKTIRYHPHTRLICFPCQGDIQVLNSWYNHRKKNELTLESMYKLLNR